MTVKIHTLRFDINRCYIIESAGTIMIDGGPPNKKDEFVKQLNNLNIDPKSIQLIVLTHGDFDHIGSAMDFKAITGAKVAIHRNDKINLENGVMNWAPGVTAWGKVSRFLFKPVLAGTTIPAFKPDIILNDEDFPLNDFGIEGQIVFTPGHSPGHVSVLLENGDCFAGCMAHNIRLFTRKPDFPIYAFDIEQLKNSWKKLLKFGADTIYPGHGNPFSADIIKNKVQ